MKNNKNSKIYKFLYYISFFVTFLLIILVGLSSDELFGFVFNKLFIINIILMFIYFILLIIFKKKVKDCNILFPILYLIFLVIIVLLALIMNSFVMEQNIHFMYYSNFILVGYIFLNIYSLMCLSK